MKVLFGVTGAVLIVIGLTWLFTENDTRLLKQYAPRQEAIRRQTFEQSKAYNEGMAQELRAMQFEYVKAAPEHKAALASIILHRVAGYGSENLPPDLQDFVTTLQRGGAR